MQALVTIGLGIRNVVIKLTGDGFPQSVYDAQHPITERRLLAITLLLRSPAFLHGRFLFRDAWGQIQGNIRIDQHPHPLHIIDLGERHVLALHFTVDAVEMLGTSRNRYRDVLLGQSLF